MQNWMNRLSTKRLKLAKDEGWRVAPSYPYKSCLFCVHFSFCLSAFALSFWARIPASVCCPWRGWGSRYKRDMMIIRKVLVVLGAVVLADCHNYDVTQKVLFPILPSGAIRSDNQLCKEESKIYMEQLDNLTLWAHESKYESSFKN